MKNTNKPVLPKGKNRQTIIIVGLILTLLGILYFNSFYTTTKLKEYKFEKLLKEGQVKSVNLILNKNLVEITIKDRFLNEPFHKEHLEKLASSSKLVTGPHYILKIPSAQVFNDNFKEIQKSIPEDLRIGYETSERFDLASIIINWGGLIVTILIFWLFFRRMPGGSGGGGIFSIGKSKAKLFDSSDKDKITFKSVAGLTEAKEEVKEIVDFLKNPEKFTNLGGKIPKGALLVGPPGTGKTLLAKAVAGEADVPFFSLAGSDFVEMFVGIGSARVRDLFKQAKDKAPCIIFIDEIDAIGRTRSNGQMPGGNDERENTLNALLVEMDGFSTNSGIIILAATNRPEVLDQALLRPGRFDRQISIDKPDLKGREAIFRVHTKPLKVSKSVKCKRLSEQTPGFAGAEIANVCNEAALIAARKNKKSIDMQDFQDAIDRVIGGLEKKDKIISPYEKEIVATHEAGHAVAGWFLEHADPLVKVSIVPRGIAALGYAQYLPKEISLYQFEQLYDAMCMALGGRAAEEIVFGKISTGALSDLERITKMAYNMVAIYGMSEKIGNISFYDPKQDGGYSFTKPYSEATGKEIDEEVRRIISGAYERTKDLLRDKRKELDIIKDELMKNEVIYKKDLEKKIGKRPFGEEAAVESMTKESTSDESTLDPK